MHRIFCVGRNYPEHAREMGAKDLRAPPFFFGKPADAVVPSGSVVPFPLRTSNLHHEIELVVALGADRSVFGYAVGNDLTRREVQALAKKEGRPWEAAKGFDHSAPITPIARAADVGHPVRGRIWLEVNGALRQEGDIADMIWNVPDILRELATWFSLQPGDLVFTGTPAGVGRLAPGDRVSGGVDGIGLLEHVMGPA
ncbi:MAG TPA: fumarylacetoacetate hydrolase family protein [Steroidobacteraceae bacterium]|nr:fumarylacetoacetate hydrolase family protein [Steroidobacteraceae bacterium]